MARRILTGVLVIIVLGVIAAGALAWRSEIDPIDPPAKANFDPALVERGQQLAAVGDCAVCHTARGGRPYAGGFPIPTPFGTIYSTNITPDGETGIGRWSEAAFIRSMREGVARDGSHLYPAFPYTHYTRTSDEDLRALYAFLMTREPVKAEAPANELPFPLTFRPVLAGWKLLYLDKGAFTPVEGESEEWNRGAYLVTGLGHCGSCHTPRNALGAEEKTRQFSGGEGEDWHGPALNAQSPAPVPWTKEALVDYLNTGFAQHHGAALGPMAEVTASLQQAPPQDISAMATYLASLNGEQAADRAAETEKVIAFANNRAFGPLPMPTTAANAQSENIAEGRQIFVGACAICHHKGGAFPATRPAELALSSTVAGPDPRNLIHIILNGVHPPPGAPGLMMPGFDAALTNEQVAALAAFIRDHFSDEPAWDNLDETVRRIRETREAS